MNKKLKKKFLKKEFRGDKIKKRQRNKRKSETYQCKNTKSFKYN